MTRMSDTKVAKEVEVLNKFMRMIDTDPDRAYYGYNHIARAHEQLAIDSLLVTDELFRASSVKTRRQYVDLVESVRENGGKVYVFSSMHISGQQLQHVSGVAAILRYPLPDLDALDEEEEEEGFVSEDESIGDDNPLGRAQEDLADMGL
mmetsp:Transcript_106145/g.158804  ORF Transcript_106145/g.158804 Transcript_106145/m.158804 type:complete len:149 (-) Transcript_106145:17-463(-)